MSTPNLPNRRTQNQRRICWCLCHINRKPNPQSSNPPSRRPKRSFQKL